MFVEECAGYRVLRVLARGEDATVLLGHDGSQDAEPVVLKIVGSPDRAGRELEALERGAGDHVVRLRDVATISPGPGGGGGVCLVLQRLGRGDLASLLARREHWPAGEVVTVVAPLGRTVGRLHDAGVAHGALAPASILFDDRGAPTLTGFGAAALFRPSLPEAARAEVPEVHADRESVRQIAVRMLALVRGDRAGAAEELRRELEGVPPDGVPAWCADRLFDLAAARPVGFGMPEPAAAPTGRVGEPRDPQPSAGERRSDLVAVFAGVLPDDLLERARRRLRDAAPRSLRRAVTGWWSGRTPRARRLIVAGAAIVATVAIATSTLSPEGSTGADPAAAPAAGAPEEGSSASPVPTEKLAEGEGSWGERGAEGAAVEGDDPVAAVPVLLAARARCYRELSVLCLDAVVEVGSAAFADDRAAILTAREGGELRFVPMQPAEPRLVERLGDSALLALDESELLLMRGSGGWRIRAYLGPDDVDRRGTGG